MVREKFAKTAGSTLAQGLLRARARPAGPKACRWPGAALGLRLDGEDVEEVAGGGAVAGGSGAGAVAVADGGVGAAAASVADDVVCGVVDVGDLVYVLLPL